MADETSFGRTVGSGKERSYTTKPGDTLESIAAYFYGAEVQRQRIIDDNPAFAIVQPGDTLPVGTLLQVGDDPERGDTPAGVI